MAAHLRKLSTTVHLPETKQNQQLDNYIFHEIQSVVKLTNDFLFIADLSSLRQMNEQFYHKGRAFREHNLL